MKYNYKNPSNVYAAPFLGNGSITLPLGPNGAMNVLECETIINYPSTSNICWAGRRWNTPDTKPVVSFGRFTDGGSPIESTQELDVLAAEVYCDTLYDNGSIKTSAFIHTDLNLIAVKKQLEPKGEMEYTFTYHFCDREGDGVAPHFTQHEIDVQDNYGEVAYELTDRLPGKETFGSILVACSDSSVLAEAGSNSVSFTVKASQPRELCFYILLADNADCENPSLFTREKMCEILNLGYNAVKEAHGKVWADYYAEGSASIGDEQIDRVYITAQYNQKCFTTKWSLPVALYNAAWDARYFGFDEHYMQMGLITSNHMNAARRVPEFRKNGLQIAQHRAESGARYPWETIEDGTEASPFGSWRDHIFHMSSIPLSGWYYYKYTLDKQFLEETVFPVLSACAFFFQSSMLYRVEGGKLIVGRCTDLERLGAAKENAYMTTCGVINVFRAYAEAAAVLGIKADVAARYSKLADELFEGLPQNAERYVPFPGCEQRSIGAFSGTFPFDVISRDSSLQMAAMEDYLAHEDVFGNMYETGRGVCSWYSCWKAVAFDRLGQGKRALDAIAYVASTAGDFYEVYEINNKESNTYWHPWFTTAAGMYIHALNEALVCSEGDIVHLLNGISEEHLSRGTDISFKLAAYGDIVIECEIKDKKIQKLRAVGGERCVKKQLFVTLPEALGGDRTLTVE